MRKFSYEYTDVSSNKQIQMANRSYIYNIDFNRLDRLKTPEDEVLSVSEYAYEIPLSYKLLLSFDTVNNKSVLWDYEHPISISGNAQKGKEILMNFLERLKKLNLYDPEYLQTEIDKTKSFFDENEFKLKYFFLEGGELYEMGNDPFEEQNLNVFNEVVAIDETIETFLKKVESMNQDIEKLEIKRDEMTKKTWFKKSKHVLSDEEKNAVQKSIDSIEINKRGLLGIDNWSTILYYQFNKQ